ncbi:stage II sporulation protein AB (anti-sigma F factor) [Aneurinibacillus soli]|uniref:Anti-sigma F factor n=1 Tax=Aneurinibacillus soli TaxID=1500254 RepID=A0A0U5B431_9BACL|nr:anti-sigma F factor [Aneurinibacillus soli]PYE62838.1 stage II sporulation protein AB (anti-sigma F factor) [Aneurinibacillus soli]BAU29104.1 Anti-sigma F factor [Aneurinibacillus soli]
MLGKSENNFMRLSFAARSENEGFARITVATFLARLPLTLEEVEEIKTVVSEAVTNSIIHGYEGDETGTVVIETTYTPSAIEILIEDQGIGIVDMEEARQPLFTTKPELERSGMGFTIMESFMDAMEVESEINRGTRIRLVKYLAKNEALCN